MASFLPRLESLRAPAAKLSLVQWPLASRRRCRDPPPRPVRTISHRFGTRGHLCERGRPFRWRAHCSSPRGCATSEQFYLADYYGGTLETSDIAAHSAVRIE